MNECLLACRMNDCLLACLLACIHACMHVCFDWLITNKSNIQNSVWTTLMKLGMWVVMATSIIHVVCLSVTKCPYLIPHLHICSDCLITKKISNIQSSVWATLMKHGVHVGSDGHKYYPCGLSSPNVHI